MSEVARCLHGSFKCTRFSFLEPLLHKRFHILSKVVLVCWKFCICAMHLYSYTKLETSMWATTTWATYKFSAYGHSMCMEGLHCIDTTELAGLWRLVQEVLNELSPCSVHLQCLFLVFQARFNTSGCFVSRHFGHGSWSCFEWGCHHPKCALQPGGATRCNSAPRLNETLAGEMVSLD